jgi:hypothetical protein
MPGCFVSAKKEKTSQLSLEGPVLSQNRPSKEERESAYKREKKENLI